MPSSLITMNDNVLAALDVETTGVDDSQHEIVQLAVVALDANLDPVDHFMSYVKPVYSGAVQAAETHGIPAWILDEAPDRFDVAESLHEWVQGLGLAPRKRLTPLCHNSQFDIPFIRKMLGLDAFNELFGYPTRDTLSVATAINDRAAFAGLPIPFPSCGLKALCERLGIPLDDAHDALADSLATARLYRTLLSTTF